MNPSGVKKKPLLGVNDLAGGEPVGELLFLGTGGAWGLPELNCDCLVCREMRRRGESRGRTALLLSGEKRLLLDCGPDIAGQLSRHGIGGVDSVLISHEHGDHYMGLDELFSYKRTARRGSFQPIPVFMTARTWEVVSRRFAYLEQMEVIRPRFAEPRRWGEAAGFAFFPFKTEHGPFAAGSVGYLVEMARPGGGRLRIVYTSDFMTLPEMPSELKRPEYLVIQSFWLNEPSQNRPHHMSFQRALEFIRAFDPREGAFLVHLGDGDRIAGDPANCMLKKYEPKDPLRTPGGGEPYPIPRHQAEWQQTVDRISADFRLPCPVTVAYDGLRLVLPD